MGVIYLINPPVVPPPFKGGQVLGKSNKVSVLKVFSGKYLVFRHDCPSPVFFLSAVPLLFQKGGHRGISYLSLFQFQFTGFQLSTGGKIVFHHLVVDRLYQRNRLSSAFQHDAWYGNHQHGQSEIQD